VAASRLRTSDCSSNAEDERNDTGEDDAEND
jgi:hypothetical protein